MSRAPSSSSSSTIPQPCGYRLTRKLSGFLDASLWKALPPDDDRPVAVKYVHPYLLPDKSAVQRTVVAARAAATLHHPNLLVTRKVIEAQGSVLLLTGSVKGATLGRVLRRADVRGVSMPAAVALRIALDVLAALDAVEKHAFGDNVLALGAPCDLSPHNVVVTSEGHAKLFDAGLGSAHANGRDYAADEAALSYQSPERFQRGEQAPASMNLFGCGALLWEMLAQRSFRAVRPSNWRAWKSWQPPRLDDAATASHLLLSTELADVVARMLNADPAMRYASAQEVRGALLALVPERPALPDEVNGWLAEMKASFGPSDPPATKKPSSRTPSPHLWVSSLPPAEDAVETREVFFPRAPAMPTLPDLPLVTHSSRPPGKSPMPSVRVSAVSEESSEALPFLGIPIPLGETASESVPVDLRRLTELPAPSRQPSWKKASRRRGWIGLVTLTLVLGGVIPVALWIYRLRLSVQALEAATVRTGERSEAAPLCSCAPATSPEKTSASLNPVKMALSAPVASSVASTKAPAPAVASTSSPPKEVRKPVPVVVRRAPPRPPPPSAPPPAATPAAGSKQPYNPSSI